MRNSSIHVKKDLSIYLYIHICICITKLNSSIYEHCTERSLHSKFVVRNHYKDDLKSSMKIFQHLRDCNSDIASFIFIFCFTK